MLAEDEFHKDGSLVVGVCNFPKEHPTTFGCAIDQQQIWKVLPNVLKGREASGDSDAKFESCVKVALAKLDRACTWAGMPFRRSLPAREASLTQSLRRSYTGPGNWLDANAGWAKVWRAACWAQLPSTSTAPTFSSGSTTNTTAKAQAHWLLGYALQEIFTPSLFSLYGKGSGVFQIDASFGWGGAVGAMLVKDWDAPVEGHRSPPVVAKR
ncbi:hypothetical protein BDZ91DRAFT_821307 [Kalaharituber pfeilii]|nr:hypothetical protein BDZ91DRAFT_821307 [Kalaharituber pfeilii]